MSTPEGFQSTGTVGVSASIWVPAFFEKQKQGGGLSSLSPSSESAHCPLFRVFGGYGLRVYVVGGVRLAAL